MKTAIITAIAFTALPLTGCRDQASKKEETQRQAVFPNGKAGVAVNFTGKAWNVGLVANDTIYNTVVGNVHFGPGARSNWHTHPAGEILIITDGVGYHRIRGQLKQTIRKGDVVKCPPNVYSARGKFVFFCSRVHEFTSGAERHGAESAHSQVHELLSANIPISNTGSK